MKRYTDLLMFILFVVFAGLQINDPDAVFWVCLYLVVAAQALLAYFYKLHIIMPVLLMMGLIFLIIINGHYFFEWMSEGAPNLLDDQGVKKGEGVREFFGLFISLLVTIYYIIRSSMKTSPEQ